MGFWGLFGFFFLRFFLLLFSVEKKKTRVFMLTTGCRMYTPRVDPYTGKH